MKNYDKVYINGQWVSPKGQGTIEVINPCNEEIVGVVPKGNSEDVDLAVAAAKAAFDTWSKTTVEQRAEYIAAIAAELGARMDEIGTTVAEEVGMPKPLSNGIQAGLPFTIMGSYAEIAKNHEFEEQNGKVKIVYEPIGVCGFITPWNYPLHQIVGKVAPALAAGCTMVVKPSREAPLNAFILAEICDKVNLPAGVFNLVSGAGTDVGERLCAHPDVDMISFTGSTSAGIRVAELAAKTVKRVTQELGGKSANILLDDADFNRAVRGAVQACYLNSGQTCSALTRLLVPASRQAEAVEIAKATAESLKVGDAMGEGTNLGPMVSASQQSKVLSLIQKGIDEGATLVTGSAEKPAGKGYFVTPSIFADVKPDMTIAQEEIFGPVLCIIPYQSEEEAVAIANDSIYGLSGGVSSADPERAIKIARQMRTGQVSINGGSFSPTAPFGGYKQSGNGREFGKWGLDEFLEVKAILT